MNFQSPVREDPRRNIFDMTKNDDDDLEELDTDDDELHWVTGRMQSHWVPMVSTEAFRGMMQTQPKLASPVLFALGQIMADRMVAGNDRLQNKVSSEFLWLERYFSQK